MSPVVRRRGRTHRLTKASSASVASALATGTASTLLTLLRLTRSSLPPPSRPWLAAAVVDVALGGSSGSAASAVAASALGLCGSREQLVGFGERGIGDVDEAMDGERPLSVSIDELHARALPGVDVDVSRAGSGGTSAPLPPKSGLRSVAESRSDARRVRECCECSPTRPTGARLSPFVRLARTSSTKTERSFSLKRSKPPKPASMVISRRSWSLLSRQDALRASNVSKWFTHASCSAADIAIEPPSERTIACSAPLSGQSRHGSVRILICLNCPPISRKAYSSITHQSRERYVLPQMHRSSLQPARKTGRHIRLASICDWSMHTLSIHTSGSRPCSCWKRSRHTCSACHLERASSRQL
mmetsp:Transcript_25544/g.66012  ORF Transcript_25544/g.66012 Transcript_25544/m.66012 type:complete len:359 (+) Transcript_25544:200-1276(+)